MKKKMLSFTILAAVICAFAFNAQASTILGYMSFSGIFQSDMVFLGLGLLGLAGLTRKMS